MWQLALPMMGTQLLWMSMPFVDNVMIGRLGPEPLAALGICATYYIFLLVTAIGVLSALNPIIAQHYGAREFHRVAPVVQSGIAIALVYGVLLVLALFLSEPILLALGQDPKLVSMGGLFLTAIAWGCPAQVVFIAFRQYADAIGFPKPVVLMVALAAFCNIFLDYALIYGWGIFPKLGIAGPGHATSFLNWVLALGLFFFTKFHPRFAPFNVWKTFSVRWSTVREILTLGAPLAGGILMEVGYFSGSTWLAGWIGPLETASHHIALNVASITFMVPMGLSFAVSVRLGHFVGAQNAAGVRGMAKLGVKNAIVLGILNATLLSLFASSIARLYTTDGPTIQLASSLLRIAGFFQIFDGLQCLGIHSLRGLKDTKLPFVFSVVSYWLVGMNLSVVLAFPSKFGVHGIWYGMISALFLAAFLNLMRLRKLVNSIYFQ